MASAPPTGSLARGAAAITAATAASRVTGFVRVIVVAGTMGTTYLANTYQTANTAPNVVFELLAAGVLTSVFVPTFVEYLVGERKQEGWGAVNALASTALVALIGLSVLLAFAAPLVMSLLTLGVEDPNLRAAEIDLGARLLRLFSPQIALYGLGMIMTAALHAHRRFFLAAFAPIFNNIVVIAVYLVYASMRGPRPPRVDQVTDAEVLVLGLGTTLGVAVMTFCLLPQLLRLGWRMRWRLEPRHEAVRRGLRVGSWALGYAGGYQAGLVVVLLLANRIEGGVAAYQWAFTFFYMPHALFAQPIFNVLFTAMSEHAAKDQIEGVVKRMRDGLGMLAFILTPIAVALLITAQLLVSVTLDYGVMSGTGAELVGRVLMAFAMGLPAYSAFLVYTRAFYATKDARTPALINAATVGVASGIGALLFWALPSDWSVPGLAFAHSVAFIGGALVIGRMFRRHVGVAQGPGLIASFSRVGVASLIALISMVVVSIVIPEGDKSQSLLELLVTWLIGGTAYLTVHAQMRSPELRRLTALVKAP